ncbi:cytochrome C oxidase subunit IV family protein [Sphingobium mellinum]|uniref:cytochrome C oxidase subunit IV family protein n=1 Tax=Sphingobium mellinum TaxID=1387166 RepID=UPI0030EF22BC
MKHDIPAAKVQPVHEGQQHPISLYLKVWGYLFVLSTLSYLVDYMHVQGIIRWTLIILFMLLKAGLILSIFMHLAWERLSLIYAILVPPLVLLVLVRIMTIEADYAWWTRAIFMGGGG